MRISHLVPPTKPTVPKFGATRNLVPPTQRISPEFGEFGATHRNLVPPTEFGATHQANAGMAVRWTPAKCVCIRQPEAGGRLYGKLQNEHKKTENGGHSGNSSNH